MSDLPLLILLLLFFAFFLRIDFIYYIVYVCVGVYVWSQWITPRVLRGLEIKRSFHDHAFLGERVTITLTISNRNRLPIPWVQLIESVPVALRLGKTAKQTLSLGGRESKELIYTVQAMRRGYYRLGPTLITLGDLFGFKENKARLAPDFLTVYPRIIPLTHLGLPSRLPFGTLPSRQRLYEDPARPIGVRDYRSGDSLRHINWKVSAHKEQLLVRTFQPAISLETAVLLNLNREEFSPRNRYDGPEWAITVAASLAAHLVNSRQAIGLATNGVDPLYQRQNHNDQAPDYDEESGRLIFNPAGEISEGENPKLGRDAHFMPAGITPRPGRAHLMKILEQLARIEAGQTVPFTDWIPRACLNLSWGVTIATISPHGDAVICQAMHRLVKSGFNPVLIVVEPYANFSETKNRAGRLGFSAFHASREPDLDMWRTPLKSQSI